MHDYKSDFVTDCKCFSNLCTELKILIMIKLTEKNIIIQLAIALKNIICTTLYLRGANKGIFRIKLLADEIHFCV